MCDDCDWEAYLEKIDEMQTDETFDFASDTIIGIHEWVAENEHITEAQKEAIDNIYDSAWNRRA